MRVLVAMSGGVDSSVAAALVRDAGHETVGVTMKLWGGRSDTGCCSASDVDDARRVAHQLGIDHHVFNFGDEFDRHVVDPYVESWRIGVTPNPCIECNRHLKFDALVDRADALGFDAVATGHHARIGAGPAGAGGPVRLRRGADAAKDQSYVLYPIVDGPLDRILFPVGHLAKADVRRLATELGLRTASKSDSQDVCFITAADGRASFLGDRIPLRRGAIVDTGGSVVGEVAAVELVTIGQRKGLNLSGGAGPRFVVDVDVDAARVTVGDRSDLLRSSVELRDVVWADDAWSRGTDDGGTAGIDVLIQSSAHGAARAATVHVTGTSARVDWHTDQPRVAPGQSVVFYDADAVLGGGLVAR